MNKSFKFYTTKLNEIVRFYKHIKFAKIKRNNNILIYGISRGGTTLLAETLVALFKARLVWEPLFLFNRVKLNAINPFSVKAYRDLELGWSPHIALHNDTKANTYFDKLFSLNVRNIRFLRFTDHKRFAKADVTVFKFCFANFMYPYFQKRYSQKAVILLRHPFAVAASSLGFGDNFNWHKDNYKSWRYKDSLRSNHFFNQYEDKYHLIVSPFTLLVFQAVSQFSYLLNNRDTKTTSVVFYEDIVEHPDKVFENLESLFNKKLNKDVFLKMVQKQSFSSKKGHTSTNAEQQLSKWKSVVTQQDISDSLKIFEAFDFKVYSDDIRPIN